MGTFRIEVVAAGGHGCDRKTVEGDSLNPCLKHGCPDCDAAQMCADISRTNSSQDTVMTFTHWPGEPTEVVDQYTARHGHVIERKRIKGAF